MSVKKLKLNDGTHVPWLAFGTGTALYGRDVTDTVAHALSAGFTHLDGAQAYENESSLGAAITKVSVPREQVYVTTKLEKIPEGGNVEAKLRDSLEKLGMEYIDLFLVHNPRQHEAREGGLKQVWREMVDVKKKGLTRSIGVSNFNKARLEEIISLDLDVPAVNQIEYHPLLAKRLAPLIEFHRAHDIVTSSYGGLTPILPSRTGDASLSATCDKIATVLDSLASTRAVAGKPATQNQVLLKWLEGEGIIAVTTSTKESRLREYLGAEGLTALTPEEKELISDAVGNVQYRSFTFVPHMDHN